MIACDRQGAPKQRLGTFAHMQNIAGKIEQNRRLAQHLEGVGYAARPCPGDNRSQHFARFGGSIVPQRRPVTGLISTGRYHC
jgi:hypothetical protein